MTEKEGDNVIFLAFRNPNLESDSDVSMLACKFCRNKTYTLSYDSHSGFPMMKCAACGQHMGRIGYTDD